MAITEKQIQEALQTLLLSLDRLEGRVVAINDWDVVRTATVDDIPMVIIENADEFENRQTTRTVTNNWTEKLTLISAYQGMLDKEAQDGFRDLRQSVLDALVDGARSAGGLEGLDLVRITSSTPIDYIYDQYARPEDIDSVTPVYIYQTLSLYFEEF